MGHVSAIAATARVVTVATREHEEYDRGAWKVSRATGIADSTISGVLSGRRGLNRAQIGKLARYFHVSPDAFAF